MLDKYRTAKWELDGQLYRRDELRVWYKTKLCDDGHKLFLTNKPGDKVFMATAKLYWSRRGQIDA